ncbi:MAG: hypothetical protein KME31_18540 [Tolypothrix carrinoi HA7290-LM1]|nr:hypothetical protein [Tolypothrix carrinoi HA7290-LM1]
MGGKGDKGDKEDKGDKGDKGKGKRGRGKGEAVRSWGLPKWSTCRERGKNYYQCPMPNAQCPMPNAHSPYLTSLAGRDRRLW